MQNQFHFVADKNFNCLKFPIHGYWTTHFASSHIGDQSILSLQRSPNQFVQKRNQVGRKK